MKSSMIPLQILEFGEKLILTEDLDPVYTILHRSVLSESQIKRWLLAYWCFYHAGFASYASEHEDPEKYWKIMRVAAQNKIPSPVSYQRPLNTLSIAAINVKTISNQWPRGTERRHFRGEKCLQAVYWLSQIEPEERIDELLQGTLTHQEVIARICKWPMFGPWIGFKAADMLERVLGVPIKFSDDIALIYKEPREALRLVIEREGYGYENLLNHFSRFPAPPGKDRSCSHQEVETILCKWKSHIGGHYPLGKDSRELKEALDPRWGRTAQHLTNYVPQ